METLVFEDSPKVGYCISTELRDEQIKINCKKVKGRIEPRDDHNESIACVSFGPSLNHTWKSLKKFKNIITCSGAYKFLLDKGIVPNYHCDLDPREHKITMLGTPNKKTEFLIASTVHPKYFDKLEGFNVKLWHIFATDEEAVRVLPKGEWSLSGGSSIGLRTLTLARFLGFKDIHVFGMDGSFENGESHTTDHPNKPGKGFEVEYNGKKYVTTPSMLHVAKETPREVDALGTCTVKFYGKGLVQDIMKNHKPKPKKDSLIAFSKPTLISEEMRELNSQLHYDNPRYGMGGSRHLETVLKLSKLENIKLIGDYGCGKGMLAKELLKHNIVILEYDPAIPGKEGLLPAVDLLVCTDVLEHIEPDKLDFVLDDMKRCTRQVGYFVISTRKAIKSYADGRNAHLIVQPEAWWNKKLSKYFEVGTIQAKNDELHVIVGPKKTADQQLKITEVSRDNLHMKFYTPNNITEWRAKTLFTKEPSTVDWILGMKPGEILWDIGANIGSYSVLAGVKGIETYSFEPEASNFAVLAKNLQLNNINPNAYCLAITDKTGFDTLYGGQADIGGACHTFGKEVGPDLEERRSVFKQGCYGMRLDDIRLPRPHHVKIDVDGLEQNVINGGNEVIANCKSVCIEINNKLEEHQTILKWFKNKGFIYDPKQVERVIRKEGPFEGCAEYIFYKPSLSEYISDRIDITPINKSPFPHMVVEGVLPDAIYNKLIKNLPDNYEPIEKTRGTRGYPLRYTASLDNYPELQSAFMDGEVKKALIDRFSLTEEYSQDLLLIRDKPGYKITPHTDTLAKVVTILFYLAEKEIKSAGTKLYTPKKKDFKCKAGLHYDFESFDAKITVPYKPNTMLIFLRTDNSFHGVEPSKYERNVLLYNLRLC